MLIFAKQLVVLSGRLLTCSTFKFLVAINYVVLFCIISDVFCWSRMVEDWNSLAYSVLAFPFVYLQAYWELLLLKLFMSCYALFCLYIRCYLKLYDSPLKSASEEDDEMSKLPPSQKKKLKQKLRKAEARAKKVLKFASSCSLEILM